MEALTKEAERIQREHPLEEEDSSIPVFVLEDDWTDPGTAPFPSLEWHNAFMDGYRRGVYDTFAALRDVCLQVRIEPHLVEGIIDRVRKRVPL